MPATIEPLDLNHLRLFEKVASLSSFSAAARVLQMPKSNVSRSIAKLEATLGTRLFQRTTRQVVLTAAGSALQERCATILAGLDEAIEYVGGLADAPQGHLKISAGIGFGINVLADILPEFLRRYPNVRVTLDLSTQAADLVGASVDCAVRMGPLSDSSMVAVRLGVMDRLLCASPTYLAAHGYPAELGDLAAYDAIEMPTPDGRPRSWEFCRASETVRVEPNPRVQVDEALTIYRLVLNGAGIGIVSGYLGSPAIASGKLVRLLPDWSLPPLAISLVFPSRRELAPAVRAFAEFLKEGGLPDAPWQGNVLAT